MGIWAITVLVCLLMSFTMIGVGLFLEKKGPQKINLLFGYRTPMSMKNKNTWKFGNLYAGKLLWRSGCVMLIVTLAATLPLRGSEASAIRTVGLILIIFHAVLLIGSIVLTEIALRKNFDNHGNRLQP